MTTDTKRQISPTELQVIFQLAQSIPDLTVIPAELKELENLRIRVKRGEAAIIAVTQSQKDLMDAVKRLGIVRGQS